MLSARASTGMQGRPLVRTVEAVLVVLATCLSLVGAATAAGANAAAVPLTIKVVGNHFVDGSGHAIRLLGVNHTSSEYGCVDGFGYDDGHFDDADAAAIASWHADAVRIPLNEDCWLGINGQPNSNEGAEPRLTAEGYRAEIERYVADLNRHRIYAILDLHWSAPGSQVALEQQPMPDQDHSPAFWSSVASTFKADQAVVFDLFNEPYDPTDPRSGSDTRASDKVSWSCWQTGGCSTAAYDEGNVQTSTYPVAGMQTLVNAVRKAGANQPVLLGGLDYANDLGDRDHGQDWLTHVPKDPRNQLAASFHNYQGKTCSTATCWTSAIAPIATRFPVVTGEFAEDDYLEATCTTKTPSNFDARYMSWADSVGVSYLAWAWILETQAEKDADGCGAYVLIDNYSSYTPSAPNGTAVHNHLLALAKPISKPAPLTLSTFHAALRTGTRKIAFTLRSPQRATVAVRGRTLHAYRAGKGKRHRLALGTVRLELSANRTRTVTRTLSRAFRTLLTTRKSVTVRFTITMSSPHHRTKVITRTVTLRAPTRT